MRASWISIVTLSVAALLAALSLVTWRQARALEGLAELDGLMRERSLVEAQTGDLHRQIQYLESRGRVVPEAQERLEMRAPAATEIVILPGGNP